MIGRKRKGNERGGEKTTTHLTGRRKEKKTRVFSRWGKAKSALKFKRRRFLDEKKNKNSS